MAGDGVVFEFVAAFEEVRQSEIISELFEYSFEPENGVVNTERHPYAVLASQDCDLLRDYEQRLKEGQQSPLNGILLFIARPASDLQTMVQGSELRRRICSNNDERYHCFQACSPDVDLAGEGFPSLVVDFRRFFSLSATSLYWQLGNGAKRRCMLSVPYREHFQSRAAFYLSRVALPQPHDVT